MEESRAELQAGDSHSKNRLLLYIGGMGKKCTFRLFKCNTHTHTLKSTHYSRWITLIKEFLLCVQRKNIKMEQIYIGHFVLC